MPIKVLITEVIIMLIMMSIYIVSLGILIVATTMLEIQVSIYHELRQEK